MLQISHLCFTATPLTASTANVQYSFPNPPLLYTYLLLLILSSSLKECKNAVAAVDAVDTWSGCWRKCCEYSGLRGPKGADIGVGKPKRCRRLPSLPSTGGRFFAHVVGRDPHDGPRLTKRYGEMSRQCSQPKRGHIGVTNAAQVAAHGGPKVERRCAPRWAGSLLRSAETPKLGAAV